METVYAGYARVTSLGSREFWEAAAVQREDTLKLFARWHPALAADTRGHRILWRGRRSTSCRSRTWACATSRQS